MIALVDCSNFFVSCERVFEPSLQQRPVAVLSSNDGCIIARSNDIKSDIPMGVPLFEVRSLLKHKGAVLRSSNFALYNDMSRRVMATLQEFSPEVDVYSIDEAFLEWTGLHSPYEVRESVGRNVGIPVRVGVAPTRTLAKAASELAKLGDGVVNWSEAQEAQIDAELKELPLEEVWGIARRLGRDLRMHRIRTACDLKHMPEAALQRYSVTLKRLVGELRGVPSDHTGSSRSKSMVSSRSFGKVVNSKSELEYALSMHAAQLGLKLRREGLWAGLLGIFISAGHGGRVLSEYWTFPVATQSSQELIKAAKNILDDCYSQDIRYKKAGAAVYWLTSGQQLALGSDETVITHSEAVDQAVDGINLRWGSGAARFGAEGVNGGWKSRHRLRSPRYTTEWSELPRVW